MTHDELSRKLEGLWHDSYKAPGYMALRNVVELHKPNGYHHANVCDVCDAIYPCPTIQAVEKELG